MVFKFLRGGDTGMESVERMVSTMLGDCRHSFDVALASLTAGEDVRQEGVDVRETDRRINAMEEQVRRALVVHVAVQGGDDVGLVMTYLLLVKKLERVGDQNKNIFDLAEDGLRLHGDEPDVVLDLRAEVSGMFAEAGRILLEQDEDALDPFALRAAEIRHELDDHIRAASRSDDPAHAVVPRVLLYRYVSRIVANLSSVAQVGIEGIERIEHEPDGSDLDD
ncbi:PhoU domain-containing protein [Euzebya rosea]|uniref:PhoU domain-containing protein n=1 Tax=Euzebya rosea TaxID=2052804 RepID=UPI000D3E983F|nr:PhoU domain-containing protein [Euzebya rosea]